MGKSNLQWALERKYAGWRGESIVLQKEIDRIIEEFSTIDDKKARIAKLIDLIRSSETIMAEIAPEWSRDTAKVEKPNVYKLPFEIGTTTRLALDILRRSAVPMSARMVAQQLVEEAGLAADDKDLTDRVRTAVDSTLRGKRGKLVEGTGDYPVYWSIKIADAAGYRRRSRKVRPRAVLRSSPRHPGHRTPEIGVHRLA